MTQKEFKLYKTGKKELPVFDSISLNKFQKTRNLWRKKNIDGTYSWKEDIEEYGCMFYLNGDSEKSTIEFTEDGFKFTNYHYDVINNASGKPLKVLRDINTFTVKANNVGHFFYHDEITGYSKLVQ